jgi:hypothetical protein
VIERASDVHTNETRSEWKESEMVNPRRPGIRARVLAVWIVPILMVTMSAGAGIAQEGIKPLPPDEKAFGLTLAEWQAAWVQWIVSIPQSINPQNDKTGLRMGIGPHMPVWFLPPGWSGQRPPLVIPAGYTLFVPAGPGGMTFYPPGERTEEDLREERQAQAALEDLSVLEMSVDGVPIPDLRRYRTTTPVFGLVLPAGNLFGFPVKDAKSQRLAAIADGYYLLLPPLPAGKHVLEGRIEGIDRGDNDTPFKLQWRFDLIIQGPNEPLS